MFRMTETGNSVGDYFTFWNIHNDYNPGMRRITHENHQDDEVEEPQPAEEEIVPQDEPVVDDLIGPTPEQLAALNALRGMYGDD